MGLATQERAAVLVEVRKSIVRLQAEGPSEQDITIIPQQYSPLHVQVNSETDFVARTDEFRGFVSAVAQAALQAPDSGAMLARAAQL